MLSLGTRRWRETFVGGSDSVSRLFIATLVISKDGRMPACLRTGVSRARSTANGFMEVYPLSIAT